MSLQSLPSRGTRVSDLCSLRAQLPSQSGYSDPAGPTGSRAMVSVDVGPAGRGSSLSLVSFSLKCPQTQEDTGSVCHTQPIGVWQGGGGGAGVGRWSSAHSWVRSPSEAIPLFVPNSLQSEWLLWEKTEPQPGITAVSLAPRGGGRRAICHLVVDTRSAFPCRSGFVHWGLVPPSG